MRVLSCCRRTPPPPDEGQAPSALACWPAAVGAGEIAKGIAGLPRGPPSALFIETKIPCSTYAIAKLNIAYNLQQLQVSRQEL